MYQSPTVKRDNSEQSESPTRHCRLISSCYLQPPLSVVNQRLEEGPESPQSPGCLPPAAHGRLETALRPTCPTFTSFPRNPDRDETLLHWGSNEPRRQRGKEPRASGAHCSDPSARSPTQGALGTLASAGRGRGAAPPGQRQAPTARAQTRSPEALPRGPTFTGHAHTASSSQAGARLPRDSCLSPETTLKQCFLVTGVGGPGPPRWRWRAGHGCAILSWMLPLVRCLAG